MLEKAGAKILPLRDPTVLPKAIKNPVEIAGQKAAQTRDGAAIARFLQWIEEEAPKGGVDEIMASDISSAAPRKARAARPLVRHHLGAGPNGAIVHYKFDPESNRPIEKGELPVDLGGQYVDGTTDITRTVRRRADRRDARPLHPRAQGPYRHRHRRFPRGPAAASSTASRGGRCGRPGLDYAHGTGHGVGSFLAVHEGPQRISPVEAQKPAATSPSRPA